MKKIFLIAIVLITIQKWDVVSAQFGSANDRPRVQGGEVILYATSWCGYCAQTRKFLSENDIKYVEYDIEKSYEGKSQYDALGVSGVPILLVNNILVKGYNPREIMRLLDD